MDHTRFGRLAQLEDEIIHVLLTNARENGRHAYIRGADIGREIGHIGDMPRRPMTPSVGYIDNFLTSCKMRVGLSLCGVNQAKRE